MFVTIISLWRVRLLVIVISMVSTFWPKGYLVAFLLSSIIAIGESAYAIATPVYNIPEALRWAVLGLLCFTIAEYNKPKRDRW